MYRISVTTLEKFRRVMQGASVFDTEVALLEAIKGTFTGNPKTRFGSAYEKIIEFPEKFKTFHNGQPGHLVDDHFFNDEQAKPAIELHNQHRHMIFQVPATKVYEAGGYTVQVSGKMDAVEGVTAHDFKCKFRAIDWQEYYDSYQWRFYLDMLGLHIFYYDVFEVAGFDDITLSSDVMIYPVESTFFNGYDGMLQDCESLVYQFMQYVQYRGITHLLKTVPDTLINQQST